MDAVSVERERAVDAIIQAFAAERSELLRNVEFAAAGYARVGDRRAS